MNFKGIEPLEPHLIKLFEKICGKKEKNMSRMEMLKECENFEDLTETDKAILCKKTIKKLSNVMKFSKW